jgi:hypothetical protein
MRMPSSGTQACIYCGATDNITDDHVPPKCLFERPLPSNLVTVPACRSCNEQLGLDDEYFKTAMVFRWDADVHPVAVARRGSAMRAMARDQARGFLRLFTDTLQSTPIVLRSGIYVGEGGRFVADMNRIRSVVRRIVRGLHYAKLGVVLPFDQEILILEDETLEQFAPDIRVEMLRSLAPVLRGEPEQLGDDVFTFFWRSQGRNSSEWFMAFYSRIMFFGATAPKAEMPAMPNTAQQATSPPSGARA